MWSGDGCTHTAMFSGLRHRMSSKMRYPSDKIIVPFLDYRYVPLKENSFADVRLISAHRSLRRCLTTKKLKNENKIESGIHQRTFGANMARRLNVSSMEGYINLEAMESRN